MVKEFNVENVKEYLKNNFYPAPVKIKVWEEHSGELIYSLVVSPDFSITLNAFHRDLWGEIEKSEEIELTIKTLQKLKEIKGEIA